MLGVAAAHAAHSSLLLAGVAGLAAGAMSMAAGEFVSVHSQADTEQADIELERNELKADDKGEQHELMAMYVGRGRNPSLAKQVARQLMVHDAIGAHARDELGISEILRASDSGCAGIGWVLRCWSSHPSLGHCDGTGEGLDSPCLRNFTGVPRSSGRASCAHERRSGNVGCTACHVLGRTCHGADRKLWITVRNRCVTGAKRMLTV